MDVSPQTTVPPVFDPVVKMTEVGEWAGNRQVGDGDRIADQESFILIGYDAFQIIEQGRQFLSLGAVGGFMIAGAAHETGSHDAIEEHLRAACNEDSVGEFLVPNG